MRIIIIREEFQRKQLETARGLSPPALSGLKDRLRKSRNYPKFQLVSPFMIRLQIAFALTLAPFCLTASSQTTRQANLTASGCTAPQVQQTAREWAQEHNFSGAVLVERGEVTLAALAFGEADREHHAPNTIETPFRIGSITKLFTTAAILREIADGRLQRDKSVCFFLNDCPASWRGVTVEHALTHADGLPDIVRQPGFAALLTQPSTPAEILARLHDVPPLFPPGKDVAYGNTGMIALSVVLEKNSGKPYSAAIDDSVVRPAHLEHTLYDDPDTIIPGRAHGYVLDKGEARNASYIDMTIPSGAGGLISTIGDLDRFTRAFLSGKLLPLPVAHDALTPKNSDYGFGWAIRDLDGRREISHIGDINGFGSFLAYYPADDTVIVALTNIERTPVADFARMIANHCRADVSQKRPD